MEQFEIRQEFEVHVTIKPTENTQSFIELCGKFTDYANSLSIPDSHVYSCKPIIIVMPEGKFKQQPMCSMFVSSSLKTAIKYGEIFSDYLQKNNQEYKFARNKVEARFRNVKNNLNLDDYIQNTHNNCYYWEFHYKVLFFKDEEKITQFRNGLELAFPMSRLSKSAMSKYEVSNSEKTSRIVTLRLYSGDKNNAELEFHKVQTYLSKAEFKETYGLSLVPGTEKELCVYDSNVLHDTGWIPTDKPVLHSMSHKFSLSYVTYKKVYLYLLGYILLYTFCKYLFNCIKI